MRDSEAFDHRAARNFLDVATRSPELWLTDVSAWIALPFTLSGRVPPASLHRKSRSLVPLKPAEGSREGWEGQLRTGLCPLQVPSIVRGIRACLEHSSAASDVQSLHTLLGVLAREFPGQLVCSMLTSAAPHDR